MAVGNAMLCGNEGGTGSVLRRCRVSDDFEWCYDETHMRTGYSLTAVRHRRVQRGKGPEGYKVKVRVRSEVRTKLSSIVTIISLVGGFVLDVIDKLQHILFSKTVHELAGTVGCGLSVEASFPVWDALDVNLQVAA